MGSEDRDGSNGANERRGEDFGSSGSGNGNGKGEGEGFSSPYVSPSTSQDSKQASGDIGSGGENRGPSRDFGVYERIRNALDHHAFGTAKATMAANGERANGSRGEQGEGGRREEAACASAQGEGRCRVTATATSAATAASAASGDINRPTVPSVPPSACCASSVSAEGGMPDRSKVGDGQGDGGGDSNRGESEHVPGVGSWREGERGAWGGTTGKMEEKEAVVLPGDGGVVDESLAVGSSGSGSDGDGKLDGFGVDEEGGVERSAQAGDDNDAAATAAAEAAAARTRDEIAFLREMQTVSKEGSGGGGNGIVGCCRVSVVAVEGLLRRSASQGGGNDRVECEHITQHI